MRYINQAKIRRRRTMPLLTSLVAAGLLVIAGPVIAGSDHLMKKHTLNSEKVLEAVENELLFDPSVTLNDIDVRVHKGTVSLYGTVDNLLEKQRAERLAETVRGVRWVDNQIEVSPTIMPSDVQLRDEISDALLLDPATDSYEVQVQARNGHITLTGQVDSWQERELTETVTKSVRGVLSVENDILVEPDPNRSDHEIREDIQAALKWDVLVDEGLLEVKVNDGSVKLTGTVGSAAERRRAISDAWVQGTTTVDSSHLTVQEWARDPYQKAGVRFSPADATVRRAILAGFEQEPYLMGHELEVSVANGVATLSGDVDTLKAKRIAAREARQTLGVDRVKNRIRIRPELERTSSEISQDVRTLLSLDPDINRHDISVTIANGKAYLTGTVDSYYEKAEAESAAATVEGVTAVMNNLAVDQDAIPVVYDPYVYDWFLPEYTWYDYDRQRTFKSDSAIKDDVKEELFWSPFVDADQVNVSVDDGVVVLSGTVDTWMESHAASQNAFEAGAVWVDNDLMVSLESTSGNS